MDIKALGTGCANCKTTIALIEQVAKARGVNVTLSKVEELRDGGLRQHGDAGDLGRLLQPGACRGRQVLLNEPFDT